MAQERKITFAKDVRAEGLKLATAAAEAQDAYNAFLERSLKARGVNVDEPGSGWSYNPLIGVASRVQ